jgi:subtilisin family serine protease
VAELLAGNKDRVPIVVAARPRRAGDVAHALAAMSAEILLLDSETDVLYARIPIASVQTVMQSEDVEATQLDVADDGLLYASRPSNDAQTPHAAQSVKPGRSPTPYTPQDNPYTGESATEALQFKTTHPTYDGRGIVIGGFELFDPLTPSLSWGLSSEGARVPKAADYILFKPLRVSVEAVPAPEQTDYGWQHTVAVQSDQTGTVGFNGKTYRLPSTVSNSELRMAVRHPHATGVSPELTLLWAVDLGRIWICTQEQSDFSQAVEVTLPTRSVQPAAVRLGEGDQCTAIVAVDRNERTILLKLGLADHGTMVASVATGHSFLNSRAEGVAPGARLLPAWAIGMDSTFTRGVLESWSALLRDPRVDLVTNSGPMPSNARMWEPEDRNVYNLWFSRLQARYPKAVFAAAGNVGPAGHLEGFPRASSAVVTVGGFTPFETWKTNFGIKPTATNTPAPYSAYGPAQDGGLKPELLGLTGTLCARESDFGNSPFYESPAGYKLSAGTSAAAPSVAGHAALLISAAKQEGLPYDVARLKMALFSSAQFLDGVEARVQGHGLIQVLKALAALRRLQKYTPRTFSVQAPVRTYYSAQFARPHIGRGLYERVGWSANQAGDREITITRTSGPAAPVTYELRWKGDTLAFTSSVKGVSLPLNQPVRLPVHIHVKESRAYSAIVDLIDPVVGLVAHSVLCTVIVSESLTPNIGFTATFTRTAPRPGHGFVFVNVPEGATALRVHVKQARGCNVTLRAQAPDGQDPKVSSSDGEKTEDWYIPSSRRRTYDQTFQRPVPGVWQLWLTHDDGWAPRSYDPSLANSEPCDFAMTVAALGVTSASEYSGEHRATVTFTKTLGASGDAQVRPLGLGSVRSESVTLEPGLRPLLYDLTVVAGTSRIAIDAAAVVATDANVSLILFRLTDNARDEVQYVAREIGKGARKHLEVVNPRPGRYRIALDAWGDVPREGFTVRYHDTVYHPLYGEAHVENQPDMREQAASYRAVVTWDPRARPEKDRRLSVEVGLFSENVVIMKSLWRELLRAGKPITDAEVILAPVPIATHTILLPDVDIATHVSATIAPLLQR